MNKKQNCYAYVGNWGVRPCAEGYGITVCSYQEETGELIPITVCAPEIHTGCVYLDRKRKVLYCVDETANLSERMKDTPGGRVIAFSVDPETGLLTEMNRQPTFAPLPSYCTQDLSGNYLLVTNHSSGAAAKLAPGEDGSYIVETVLSDAPTVVYPLAADGRIEPVCDLYLHKAEDNQAALPASMAHPHSVNRAIDGKHVFVCDKGLDLIYSFELREGKLIPAEKLQAPAGSAPRYSAVHPRKPYLFVNYEERPEVTSFLCGEDGSLREICTVSILPDGDKWEKKQQSSDIRLNSDGRILYNLLRGSNMITVLAVDERTGMLSRAQTVHFEATDFCGGGARCATISPDGRFLFVCVADDGDIHRFAIRKDGLLDEKDTVTHIGHASNLTFFD